MKAYRLEKGVQLYRMGDPYNTEAVIETPMTEIDEKEVRYLKKALAGKGLRFTYTMDRDDIIFGLGENMGGINKRGKEYVSFCTDDYEHTEGKKSLYASHSFFIVDGRDTFGVFIDYPGKMKIDAGFTHKDTLEISVPNGDVDIYIMEGKIKNDIVKKFRRLIGKSYVPPKWGFGYQQCRWSYPTATEIEKVVLNMRERGIPCDTVYMDIDYMTDYKDFTVDETKFPQFPSFVEKMKGMGIKLIPIIDAGVKIEDGYDIYEEGMEKGYFCTTADDDTFVGAVWPGKCAFPDFLNPDARKWWGGLYKRLTDQGIEGFWNDMNEPALFYTPDHLEEVIENVKSSQGENLDIYSFFKFKDMVTGLSNREEDYKKFWHVDKNGQKINHYDVHNLYGYNMTRAASEGFLEIRPDKRTLMFSRASSIGAHRYGGIWTGDNKSWWSHILLNIQMMPGLSMCGFLYSGGDTGGFGDDADSELVTRWTQFSIFTPLLRNHAGGTRPQEPYSFCGDTAAYIKGAVQLRYALLPYLYSEFMKARRDDTGYMSPLAFEYDDKRSKRIEDQILCGDSLMLAPIYTQNARGRYIYLPEDMLCWRGKSPEDREIHMLRKGDHYLHVGVDEIPFFIRRDRMVAMGKVLNYVGEEMLRELNVIVNLDKLAKYEFYDDDGVDTNLDNQSILKLRVGYRGDEVVAKVEKTYGETEIVVVNFEIHTNENQVIHKKVYL